MDTASQNALSILRVLQEVINRLRGIQINLNRRGLWPVRPGGPFTMLSGPYSHSPHGGRILLWQTLSDESHAASKGQSVQCWTLAVQVKWDSEKWTVSSGILDHKDEDREIADLPAKTTEDLSHCIELIEQAIRHLEETESQIPAAE